jgi:hypothetical protein
VSMVRCGLKTLVLLSKTYPDISKYDDLNLTILPRTISEKRYAPQPPSSIEKNGKFLFSFLKLNLWVTKEIFFKFFLFYSGSKHTDVYYTNLKMLFCIVKYSKTVAKSAMFQITAPTVECKGINAQGIFYSVCMYH